MSARQKQYVIVDVGCIECGEGTRVLGIYRSKASADEALSQARTSMLTDNEGNYFAQGQHHVGLYEADK